MAFNIVGDSKSGAPAFRNVVRQSLDLGAQAANATTENTITPIAGSLFQTEDYPFVQKRSNAPTAGLFYSHARRTAGSADLLAGFANSTVAPVDPATSIYVAGSFRTLYNRRPSTGPYSRGISAVVSIDSASIAANTSVFTSAVTFPFPVYCAFASPRAALPVGLAFDVATTAIGLGNPSATVDIGLHNLTGIAVDPGALVFDVVAFVPFDATLDSIASARTQARISPYGPPLWRRALVMPSIDFGAIGAAAVVEATATIAPIGNRTVAPLSTLPGGIAGPVALANPVAALPAGLAISHARISAANTVAIGLANVTGAPIDPAAIQFDVMVLTPN